MPDEAPERPGVISFDFDGTIDRDPGAFLVAMRAFLGNGWTVIVTTQRGDHRKPTAEEVIGHLFDRAVPVVRAYGRPKEEAARAAGFAVDVWVDDDPSSVTVPTRDGS